MLIELVNGQLKHLNCPAVPFELTIKPMSNATWEHVDHDSKTIMEGEWHQQEAHPHMHKHCLELWEECTQSTKSPQCKHGMDTTGMTQEEKWLKIITGEILELSKIENLKNDHKMPAATKMMRKKQASKKAKTKKRRAPAQNFLVPPDQP